MEAHGLQRGLILPASGQSPGSVRLEDSSELFDVGPNSAIPSETLSEVTSLEEESIEGPGPGHGISLVSWRPPDRAAWSRLGRSSKRVREGEMELRWVAPAPDQAQRMAVRLRRKNGPAPLRNRIRRILRELHREHAIAIGEIWMLWTFVPGRLRMPTRDLRETAGRLLAKAGLLAPKSP